MRLATGILALIWGGCFGFAGIEFARTDEWGLLSLTIGMGVAIFYLVLWQIHTS